jgi:hypothetical protein
MYGRDVDSNEERNEDRAHKFIQRIQQVHQEVREQLEKIQAQYKARHEKTGLIISSRLETRYGFTSTRRD